MTQAQPIRVADLQCPRFTLVQDSQDIVAVLESIGYAGEESIGCLFVEVLDGDYGQVYAVESFIPRLHAIATRIR